MYVWHCANTFLVHMQIVPLLPIRYHRPIHASHLPRWSWCAVIMAWLLQFPYCIIYRMHSFPFNKFRKISSVLSRAQTSLLIQLRTGHIPLNSYLHRIKKSDTRRCTNCWDAGRGSIIEKVIHYLFECQAHAAERYDMDRVLGCVLRDLKGILARLDKIKELLKFMGRTSRFKTTLGDTIGDVSHLEPEEGWQIAPLF